MTAFTRLSSAIGDLTAENTDLKNQLASSAAKPAGTTDKDLDGLTSKIEAAIGHSVADPDTASEDSGTTLPSPSIGPTSTSMTDPATGNTTTLDHASGEATTTDASGATVPTDQTAADAAKAAAQEAGAVAAGV